ncbi:Gap junction beta-4 protein isoform 1 [Hibiscus syriacus]|uniref:Gap junction beta-4 protein isoform 1 n=1 Tax=Hibiscus syriacus TaxID=106335 RepID=A0A6A3CCP9_HIBSY|nr:Gap junction beta-4 protein isoform 1 [Hibiscus syriacus]
MKKTKKTQISIHNSTLHLLAGILFTCSLFFFSDIPSPCSSMKQFLSIYLPCIWSSFSNPKCLFIVVNVIVIFLVGESGVVGSNKSPADGDVYDEYVERSRFRVRGTEAGSNEDKKMDCEEEVIRCEFESAEEGTSENIAEEEDEQVVELPAEELNKRVEEFIARVNKTKVDGSSVIGVL